jgi:ribonuclease P protein component
VTASRGDGLKAADRVRKRPEFQLIQGAGRRVPTQHFVLLLYARSPSPDVGRARLGITVSRRVGNAVVRSRAKRLVREAFRRTRELWSDGVDLVVIVRRPPVGLKLQHVIDEWQSASRQISRRSREAEKDLENRQLLLAESS